MKMCGLFATLTLTLAGTSSNLPRHFHLFRRALLGTLRLHTQNQLVNVFVGGLQ